MCLVIFARLSSADSRQTSHAVDELFNRVMIECPPGSSIRQHWDRCVTIYSTCHRSRSATSDQREIAYVSWLSSYIHCFVVCVWCRLAKKKQETEKRRRELEAAQKTEEERLLAKHKVDDRSMNIQRLISEHNGDHMIHIHRNPEVSC